MKKILTLAIVTLALSTEGFGWGQKGHDTTCKIAENHLTCKARRHIRKILDGKSIVYWSNWLDNASHTPEYDYTKTWHYKDVDKGKSYDEMAPAENGDVVTAITDLIAKLKSGELSKNEEALALKMLVHLVGDLHQPMHMGRTDDLGGNLYKVNFFKTPTNLHGIWDSNLLESGHKWTYTEWADQLDRLNRKERKAMVQGSIDDWGRDTHAISEQVYEDTPEEANLSYDYVAKWTPVIEKLLLQGGIRLAYILNDIY